MHHLLTNPATGMLLLSLAALLLLVAGVLAFRGRTLPALLALIGLGFCLRLHTVAAEPYLQPWDERYHALVARNMVEQPMVPMLYADPAMPYDYRDWTANRYWLHKPPLTLWTIAKSMQLFGVNLFALRLPSLLLSTGLIAVMFGFGRWLVSTHVGLWAAFLVSISGVMVELPAGRIATDHVDMAFIFFITLAGWAGLAFARNSTWRSAGLFALTLILAVYAKWFTALFLLPVAATAVLFHRAKGVRLPALQLVVTSVAVLAAAWVWQQYTQQRFPLEAAWESSYNLRHLIEPLEGHRHEWHYHISRMGQMFGWLCFPALIWLMVRSWDKVSSGRASVARVALHGGHSDDASSPLWIRAGLTAWWLLPLLVFTIAATKMRLYILPVAPVCWLAIAVLLDDLWRGRGILLRIRAAWVRRTLTLVVVCWALLDLDHEVRLFKKTYGQPPAWMVEIDLVSKHLAHSPGVRPVVFNARQPIELMFHTGATAYARVPQDSAWNALEPGRTHLVLNHPGENLHGWPQLRGVTVLDVP